MSDNVPEEVVADILLRFRVNDLIRCRRVSKQWLSIIDDPHFISRQLQLSISTNTNAALYLQDRRSPILFWKQRYASDINFFSTPIKYEPSEVSLMGSCHGLVCFSLFNHPGDFVLLNPSTGERHTVRFPMVEKRVGETLQAFGFGYDESSDDYKVVRIIQTKADMRSCSYRAEIHGVRSKGFSRTIHVCTAFWNYLAFNSIGVFVRGSIHWCTSQITNFDPIFKQCGHLIQAIDLVSNTFHQLQCPDYIFGPPWFDNLNVGIVNTRLSVCGLRKKVPEISIWVMDEYGDPKSWNRIFRVDLGGYGITTCVVNFVGSNGDKILLMLDSQRFVWCDPTKNEDETMSINGAKWCYGMYEAIYCLESLVKIFPNQSADQEILQSCHPASPNPRNLNALMYEDYDYYVD